MDSNNISRFLDAEGRLTQLPRRRTPRLAALEYLATKFEYGITYNERQINVICDQWHTFGDYFILRRELVDYGLLARKTDGSQYWRAERKPDGDTADGGAEKGD